ncbi:MAG: protein phosphatase 2C domain-containing protein, partial [Acidobacteriota bacterium]
MVWFSLDVATATDPGRVRARNEDSVAVYTPSADDGSDVLGLTVVADGMGGGQAGDRASALVAERMRAWFASGAYRVWLDAPRNDAASSGSDTEELGVMRRPFGSAYRVGMTRTLRRGLRAVNEEMLALAGSSDDLHGMGSTVVLALFHDHHVWIGHVGDSRCYRIRGGQIELLTRDHTWVHQQVELGLLDAAEAEGHPQRHILLRSLGDTEPPHLDVRIEDLHDGDRFL